MWGTMKLNEHLKHMYSATALPSSLCNNPFDFCQSVHKQRTYILAVCIGYVHFNMAGNQAIDRPIRIGKILELGSPYVNEHGPKIHSTRSNMNQPPLFISNNASMLLPKSPPFASNTHSITSKSVLGNI